MTDPGPTLQDLLSGKKPDELEPADSINVAVHLDFADIKESGNAFNVFTLLGKNPSNTATVELLKKRYYAWLGKERTR